MPQRLDNICGVIKNLRVLDDTAVTIAFKCRDKRLQIKAALIDYNSSSSTTGSDLESEYCGRFKLNGSGSLTSNLLELGSQVPYGDVKLDLGKELPSSSVSVWSEM